MSGQHRPRPGGSLSLRGKPLKALAALDQRQVQLLFQLRMRMESVGWVI